MHEGIAGRLEQGRAFLGHEVHNTLGSNAPALCGVVFDAVHGDVVDGELGLIVHLAVLIAAGILDRNKVDVLPGGVVGGTVRTVGIDGTHGLLPHVEIGDELLCESLQGVGSALVTGIHALGELAVSLVLGEHAGDDDGGTVGRESDPVAVAGVVGLVGDLALLGNTRNNSLGHVDQVFGLIAVLGTVGYLDGLLVVAVPLGMRGGLDFDYLDVILDTGIDVYQSIADCILVLGNAEVLVADLERLGEGFVSFPGAVGGCGRIHNL